MLGRIGSCVPRKNTGLERLAGIAGADHPGWHVFGYNTVRTNDGAFADGHARGNKSTGKDKSVCTDLNSSNDEREFFDGNVMTTSTNVRMLGNSAAFMHDDGTKCIQLPAGSHARPVFQGDIPWHANTGTGSHIGTARDLCSEPSEDPEAPKVQRIWCHPARQRPCHIEKDILDSRPCRPGRLIGGILTGNRFEALIGAHVFLASSNYRLVWMQGYHGGPVSS